jgi:hypothetical protein
MTNDDTTVLLGAIRGGELGLGLCLGTLPTAFLDIRDARLLLIAEPPARHPAQFGNL